MVEEEEEEEEATVEDAEAKLEADAVDADAARTTLAINGRRLRDYAQHLDTMCSTMGTRQQPIRCAHT